MYPATRETYLKIQDAAQSSEPTKSATQQPMP